MNSPGVGKTVLVANGVVEIACEVVVKAEEVPSPTEAIEVDSSLVDAVDTVEVDPALVDVVVIAEKWIIRLCMN